MSAVETKTCAATQLTWAPGEAFQWLKRGVLSEILLSGAEDQRAFVAYAIQGGRPLILTNDLSNAAFVVRREVEVPDAVFISKNFPKYFLYTQGYRTDRVIDGAYVTSYLTGKSPDAATLKFVSSAAKELNVKLNKGRWTVQFYTIGAYGNASHWKISGKLNDFDIEHVEQSVVKKKGALKPIIELW